MDMIIISGFLGSGKTTLILGSVERIRQRTGKRIAIIVNDFGNIGIDGKVMERHGLTVRELPSGCICCTLGSSFLETVSQLNDRFKPDLLIVEPSGIANPNLLLDTMKRYTGPPLGSIKVVVLVDTVRFPILVQVMINPLLDQLKVGDMIVLTKADEVDEQRMREVEGYTREAVGDIPIIPVSSADGRNMDEFVDMLMRI